MITIWTYVLWLIVFVITLFSVLIRVFFFNGPMFDIAMFGTIGSMILWIVIFIQNNFENNLHTVLLSVGLLMSVCTVLILFSVRSYTSHKRYRLF